MDTANVLDPMTLLDDLNALEFACRSLLFERNTGLAFKVVKRSGRGLKRHDLEDLGQVCLVALWNAACKYDPRRKFLNPKTGRKQRARFSTYATWACTRAALSAWRRRARHPMEMLPDGVAESLAAAEQRERERWDEAEWERRLDAIPDPRKREALRLRYRESECVDSIAVRLGVTRQRVQQMLSGGLDGLREAEGVACGMGLFAEAC